MKIFSRKFLIFFLFGEAVLRGGSNEYPQSMIWSKIRKIGVPLHTPVLLYESGVQGGIYITDMFS